jgi:hypothetical protein
MSGLPCPSCRASMPVGSGEAPRFCPACGATLVVCGRYRLCELLGQGGMGVVYGAVREPDGVPVAVKLLSLGHGSDWKTYELFERGSKVLQGLSHRGLPAVHAFEQDPAGRLILVRERFDGGTLEHRIVADQRRLDPAGFRRLLDGMLELLEFLHGQVPPVFHRDIKPPNIMFRTAADWDPVLVDFDTVAAPGAQQGRLTIVCSPGYTAPEQLTGEVSPASDLFSLGATMLFVATGTQADEQPREHGRFSMTGALANLEPTLLTVLRRLVEPDLARRYASAADARADLAPPAPVTVAAPPPAEPLVEVSRWPAPITPRWQPPPTPEPSSAVGPSIDAVLLGSPDALTPVKRSVSRIGGWLTGFTVLGGLVCAFLALGFVAAGIAGEKFSDGEALLMTLGLVIVATVATLSVYGIGRLLCGAAYRREYAWVEALPFKVTGYFDALAARPQQRSDLRVTLTFAGETPHPMALEQLVPPGSAACAAAVRRPDARRLVVSDTVLAGGADGPSTNRAIRDWFHALVEGALPSLNTQHPIVKLSMEYLE